MLNDMNHHLNKLCPMNKSKDIDNVNPCNLSDNNMLIDLFDRSHHSHKSFLWKLISEGEVYRLTIVFTWWETDGRSIDFRTITSWPTRWTDFFTCYWIACIRTGTIIIGNTLNGTLFTIECRSTIRFQGNYNPVEEYFTEKFKKNKNLLIDIW